MGYSLQALNSRAYSVFSLCATVMFWKVAVGTESVIFKPLPLGEAQG